MSGSCTPHLITILLIRNSSGIPSKYSSYTFRSPSRRMAKRRYFLIRNASEPACFFAIVGTPPRSSSPTGSWSRRSAVGKCSSLHARVLVRACAAVLVCWLLVLRRLRRPPNEPMHAGNGPPVLELPNDRSSLRAGGHPPCRALFTEVFFVVAFLACSHSRLAGLVPPGHPNSVQGPISAFCVRHGIAHV